MNGAVHGVRQNMIKYSYFMPYIHIRNKVLYTIRVSTKDTGGCDGCYQKPVAPAAIIDKLNKYGIRHGASQ
jgi:hypothetical protein